MGLRITSVELQGFNELFERFVRLADPLQSAAEVIANSGSFYRVRPCAERSLVASDGIGPHAFAGKSVTEIELHIGRSRFHRHGILIMCKGLFHLTVSHKSRA